MSRHWSYALYIWKLWTNNPNFYAIEQIARTLILLVQAFDLTVVNQNIDGFCLRHTELQSLQLLHSLHFVKEAVKPCPTFLDWISCYRFTLYLRSWSWRHWFLRRFLSSFPRSHGSSTMEWEVQAAKACRRCMENRRMTSKLCKTSLTRIGFDWIGLCAGLTAADTLGTVNSQYS